MELWNANERLVVFSVAQVLICGCQCPLRNSTQRFGIQTTAPCPWSRLPLKPVWKRGLLQRRWHSPGHDSFSCVCHWTRGPCARNGNETPTSLSLSPILYVGPCPPTPTCLDKHFWKTSSSGGRPGSVFLLRASVLLNWKMHLKVDQALFWKIKQGLKLSGLELLSLLCAVSLRGRRHTITNRHFLKFLGCLVNAELVLVIVLCSLLVLQVSFIFPNK